MAVTRGNLATKSYPQPYRPHLRQLRTGQRPQKQPAGTLLTREKVTLLLVGFGVSLCLILIQVYVSFVYDLNLDAKRMEDQIVQTKIEMEQVQKRIEMANNPSIILAKAKKLGLVPVDYDSVIYVNPDKQ